MYICMCLCIYVFLYIYIYSICMCVYMYIAHQIQAHVYASVHTVAAVTRRDKFQ